MPATRQANPATGLLAQYKHKLSMLEKCTAIDGTSWANSFSYAQIKRLSTYFDCYQVPKDTLLFYEGDKDVYLVLIITGAVHIVKFDSLRKARHIATLGPGKTIGEMGLIDGEPRSASAVTAEDATFLVMTAEKFNQLLDDRPRVGSLLVIKIAKLMSQHLRQTSGRLIDTLKD